MLALELLCIAAVPWDKCPPAPELDSGPLLPEPSLLLVIEALLVAAVVVEVELANEVDEKDDEEEGKRAAISCSALLILLRRPCSAILCEVRLEVRLVERASG